MNREEKLQSVKVLRAAAQAIRELGLAKQTRHQGRMYESACCALGAIETAKYRLTLDVTTAPEDTFLAAVLPVITKEEMGGQPWQGDGNSTAEQSVTFKIANWSNAESRTPREVIQAFEHAANSLERGQIVAAKKKTL